jgi:plasmid stabilization system protein ParE
VNPRVRFEDEAEEEYRLAGRWYEQRREHLGVKFLGAVDAIIDQIVAMPRVGSLVPGLPPELPVRRRPVTRFPYHVI